MSVVVYSLFYAVFQYFTLPHLLCRTLVDLTSKLPNTSFWTTLHARVRWSLPDSARLQQLNHHCGLGLGFRLGLGLGLGVRQVYIYCGRRSQQLSELSPPGFRQTPSENKIKCHIMSHHHFQNFILFLSPPESTRVHHIPPYSAGDRT